MRWIAGIVLAVVLTAVSACADTSTPRPESTSGESSDASGDPADEPPDDRADELRDDPPDEPPDEPADSDETSGPSDRALERATAFVESLSLDRKAGQVIVAGFEGTTAPVELVRSVHLGGVIVMGHNVESPSRVRAMNRRLIEASGRRWPLLIGVDQEGGEVTRIGPPFTTFASYQSLGAAGEPDLAERVAKVDGDQLRRLGFTAVFAPDADVTIGPEDPTIASRSAGSDPEHVAEIVRGSVRGYEKSGIISVAKHFPGHGSVTADSHVDLPEQPADADTLTRRDLPPFRAAIEAAVPAVMIGHLDVRAIDPGVPSSLSSEVIDGVLRKRLGFDGLVVTDALDMGALAPHGDTGQIAVAALRAGADVLLMPEDPVAARDAIVGAVRAGVLDEQRLDEAAVRMVASMLDKADAPPPDPAPGAAADLAYEQALAGLTVVDGPCRGPLVERRVVLDGGTADDREAFTTAAERAGLQVVDPAGSDAAPHSSVRLLGAGTGGGTADVVVALDSPYGLGRSTGRTARLALFGRSSASFRALVDVLTGKARGTGRLPVDVSGVPANAGCS